MLPLSAAFVFLLFSNLFADTLYFDNGQKIDGLIKKEDVDAVELEICLGGVVEFKKSEIERIERFTPEEADALRQKWLKQKSEDDGMRAKQKALEPPKPPPKKIQPKTPGALFTEKGQSIMLDAVLNKDVPANLVLDTGATFIILKKEMAERLGISLEDAKLDAILIMADGRRVSAKYIQLDSVRVGDVEAQRVGAAIMTENSASAGFADGLLGMSFLKRFNFKIDYNNQKLILEKLGEGAG